MLPYLTIGDFQLPLYGLVSVIGFLLAVVVCITLTKKYNVNRWDLIFASFFCAMGVLIGAKILYFLTTLPRIIEHFDVFKKNIYYMFIYGFSGFVFYGGLIGGAIGVVLYCKFFKVKLGPIMTITAPGIPLMHSFGRVACFLSGCCYGKEYHGPFAVTYPMSSDIKGLGGVERFPTQLTEAAFDFVLFIILFIYVKKKNPPEGRALGIYITAYTIERFFLEFLRGDAIRGIFFGLSTSQWISLLLLPLGIYLIRKKEQNKEGSH